MNFDAKYTSNDAWLRRRCSAPYTTWPLSPGARGAYVNLFNERQRVIRIAQALIRAQSMRSQLESMFSTGLDALRVSSIVPFDCAMGRGRSLSIERHRQLDRQAVSDVQTVQSPKYTPLPRA